MIWFVCASYRSPSYMRSYCKASCSGMKQPPRRNECIDVHENCSIWSQDSECETNNFVKKYCPLSCGRCENTGNIASGRKVGTGSGETASKNNNTKDKERCEDYHEKCSGWAVRIVICCVFFSASGISFRIILIARKCFSYDYSQRHHHCLNLSGCWRM